MDAVSRQLARLWIYAIVLSAAAETAGFFATVVLSRALAVSDAEAGALTTTVFVSVGIAVNAAAVVLLGVLTGRVLDCKLPAFPTRSWIAAHALVGVLFGLFASLPFTSPRQHQSWTGESMTTYALGSFIAATIFGLLLGLLQAWALRRTARGLVLWIGCSALAGVCYQLRVPIDVYGPQAGILSELARNGAGFVVAVAQGLVLLPAMLRLRPRGDHPVPALFE
jgi:hypothetical protein